MTLLTGGAPVNPFLDVGYRIVAIYLCVDCGRQLWRGLVERKITSFNPDILDWLLGWSRQVFHRETAPVRYWMEFGMRTITMVLCFVAAIVGWWQPNS